MARRVFFSFHFDNDIWRANQVRNSNVVLGVNTAGYFDHSEYVEAKKQGDNAIRRMILKHLDGTSVTVVLIGTETANRPWVQYEIEQSILRKNGLLGIQINWLKNQNGQISLPGPIPRVPFGVSFPYYPWDANAQRFAAGIEEAGKRADALRAGR